MAMLPGEDGVVLTFQVATEASQMVQPYEGHFEVWITEEGAVALPG